MSLGQIQAFLEASDEVEFKAGIKEDLYDWVNQTLEQLNYRKLKRSGRELVRRCVSKDDRSEPGAGDAPAGDVLWSKYSNALEAREVMNIVLGE